MFLRTNVSRKAAGKGRAVLEKVGLDAATIESCFMDNPNEEEAVQAGLIKWTDGHKGHPSTWKMLLLAMKYAEIAQQHIQNLKRDLGLPN